MSVLYVENIDEDEDKGGKNTYLSATMRRKRSVFFSSRDK